MILLQQYPRTVCGTPGYLHPDMDFLQGNIYKRSWDVYNLVSVFRAATNIAHDAQGLQELPRPCSDALRFSSFFSDLSTKVCGDTIELVQRDALRVVSSIRQRFHYIRTENASGHRVVMKVHNLHAHFNFQILDSNFKT